MPKYSLKPSSKLKPDLYVSKIKYKSIVANISIGNIEVTNILQIFAWGKKSNINQKGSTPIFNQR